MRAKRESECLGMSDVPQRPSTISVLEACSLLNALLPDERLTLAEHSFMAYAERGEVIWLAGSPAQFTGVVASGFVKMTRSTPQGSEVAVELLGPAQCFGLIAVIEGREYPLSASAVTNCWYLKIPSSTLIKVYKESGAMRDQVLRGIAPRLRKAHDMMARLASGKVEARLAAVLLILSDSYGKPTKEGIQLVVPLTRQDLSEMAGTTVETTIRIMSKWHKDEIVTTDHKKITIQDLDALNELLQI